MQVRIRKKKVAEPPALPAIPEQKPAQSNPAYNPKPLDELRGDKTADETTRSTSGGDKTSNTSHQD